MKPQIRIINCIYEKDIYYAALSFCGGSITKNFLLEEDEIFEGNRAFFNVLFNYFRRGIGEEKYHYYAAGRTSCITFISPSGSLSGDLNYILRLVLLGEYKEEIFAGAKEDTKKNFSKLYKEEKFRALNKAYEFSDLNKRYTLKGLIADIENIDFEKFKVCAENLLISENICIFISGEAKESGLENLDAEPLKKSASKKARLIGYNYDPFLRQDANIFLPARHDFNMEILAFGFLNRNISNMEKRLILEIFAQLLNLNERYIWIDSMDAAIIFPAEAIKSYKKKIDIPDEESFEKVKIILLSKYAALLKEDPEQFCLISAQYMQTGVNTDEYMKVIDSFTCEMFAQLCEKADFIITEAQIVLRKETG